MIQIESIFSQAIAVTSMIGELYNNDFLESNFYKNMKWSCGEQNKNNIKNILKASGLGNPAMLQMYLYALLVVPKENLDVSNRIKGRFNSHLKNYIEQNKNQNTNKDKYDIESSYKNEKGKDVQQIDFFRHIRNAIAHSRCNYYVKSANGSNKSICFVEFIDINEESKVEEKCTIEVPTSLVGELLGVLQKELMGILNESFQGKPQIFPRIAH